ncbi:hypothetical protein N7530_005920 [Penicillium desertorum]|uniref:Uncharacterized protein n=1 Tax=Penicillium desertorum TaxID=1303715 RepID=A0A9X0BSA6_9EURO|nr:hypothetical protein N7530_005920 [Penicillium desertorum]
MSSVLFRTSSIHESDNFSIDTNQVRFHAHLTGQHCHTGPILVDNNNVDAESANNNNTSAIDKPAVEDTDASTNVNSNANTNPFDLVSEMTSNSSRLSSLILDLLLPSMQITKSRNDMVWEYVTEDSERPPKRSSTSSGYTKGKGQWYIMEV